MLRFAQKIGFSGYTEMKNFLKWEKQAVENPITKKDFGELVISTVQDTVHNLNNKDLSTLYDLIDTCENIYITGTGFMQQGLANEMQRVFLGIGKNMQVLPLDISTNLYQLVSERISENDLLIVFSGSGNNPILKEALSIPIIKKVKIVGICGSEYSFLMEHSTYRINVPVKTDKLLINHWFSSSSAFYTVIEILAYNYLEHKNKTILFDPLN